MSAPQRRLRGPRRPPTGATARGARRGLSVVEVLVAVVIFGIASTGLAAMTFWVGMRASQVAGATSRAAALAREGDRLASTPFETLRESADCREDGDQAFPYTRCVRIEELSPVTRRVVVIVTPRQPRLRADTLVFERARATPYNPLQ